MRDLGAILRSGRRTLGTWNQIAAPEIIDLIGWNGFDYAVIDCEHGPFGIEAAERQGRACRAAGLAPAVRVPSDDRVAIMKALDAGLDHVVVPNMVGGAMAARAVAATRYAPDGTRGACPCVRATGHHTTDWPAHVRRTAATTGIIPLVETAEGMATLHEIVATEGLTAVMVGPFDLAVSLGLEGNWRDGRVQEALTAAVTTAADADVPIIMPLFAPDADECAARLEAWSALGVTNFMIGSDKILLAHTLGHWTTRLRPSA
ncbi:MAG: aldolase/citrate lyase family protein [Pseudomonadota bacterium]